jgi:DNA-binding transcriptional regulator LsrR (DeoR family)
MEMELTLEFKEDVDILAFGEEQIIITIQGIGPGVFNVKHRLEEKYKIVDCHIRPQLINHGDNG